MAIPINIFGFTRTELQIIEHIQLLGMSTAQLAKQFEVSARTISNHKTSINAKAKTVFPLNLFRDTEDVVRYLVKQMII